MNAARARFAAPAIAGLLVAATLGATACSGKDKDDWPPDQLAMAPRGTGTAKLALGKQVYERDCIGCHGEKGDGNGPATRFLQPKPRDFTKGIFKFANVASGELPHASDLVRTLRLGLAGTSMPAWPLMPNDEIDAVVLYLETLSPRWTKKSPAAAIVPTEDPFAKRHDKGVDLGRRVYDSVAQCWSCHAAYETKEQVWKDTMSMSGSIGGFRDRMYESVPKKSDWGYDIRPPDFTTDPMKAGASLDDLYRDIACGIGGTAMPMWRGALTEDQLWGLVHYVKSLVDERGTPAALVRVSRLASQVPFTIPEPTIPEPDATPASTGALPK